MQQCKDRQMSHLKEKYTAYVIRNEIMGVNKPDRADDAKKGNAIMTEWVPDMKIPVNGEYEDCDYDTAISIAGHGRYNNILILAAVSPIISCLLSTSTMSFILPSAECDLGLTNFRKGLLNAATYICMIATGFVWGFLSDTLGRQKLLVLGFGFDAIFNIIAGMSQNFTVLLVAKLLDGVICAGPYAILMTYLAECNPDKYRPSVVQWSGLLTALGTILLPLLAWGILPLDIELLDNVSFSLNSWRLFLLLSAIPSIIASISFYFRWESPKFLLSRGKDKQALSILQNMYSINTGLPPESYPVKSLCSEQSCMDESDVNQKSVFRALFVGLKQMKPFIQQPYLGRAILVFLFQFGALLGYNTIRLWMPQLFASIMEAENSGNMSNASTVCDLLKSNSKPEDFDEFVKCINGTGPILVDAKVYFNSIIIGFVTAVGFLGAGYLTRFVRDVTLILLATCVAVISCVGMYWAISSYLMLAFSSLFVTSTSISSTAIISVTIQLFPTETRTMAVALVMMFGQTGGMLGNVIFPVLLDWNCTVPFFLLASLLFATGGIVLFLPKDNKQTKT